MSKITITVDVSDEFCQKVSREISCGQSPEEVKSEVVGFLKQLEDPRHFYLILENLDLFNW